MEKRYCDECGCDIEIENNSFELVSRKNVHGTKISSVIGEFCSLGCSELWIKKYRREVSKTIKKGPIPVITYFNYELQKYFTLQELQEEGGKLFVKEEIWNDLIKK